jgi:hypothetical protein
VIRDPAHQKIVDFPQKSSMMAKSCKADADYSVDYTNRLPARELSARSKR